MLDKIVLWGLSKFFERQSESTKTALGDPSAEVELDYGKLGLSALALWLIWGKRSQEAQIEAPPEMRMRRVRAKSLDERIKIIKSLIDEGKQDPQIRQLAAQILTNVPAGDEWAEVESIFNWVRNNIRYTQDVENFDTYQRARRTLELSIGDCDDMTILIAALLGSVGYTVQLKVTSQDGTNWTHIYPIVQLKSGQSLPLDATIQMSIGSEVQHKKFRVYY